MGTIPVADGSGGVKFVVEEQINSPTPLVDDGFGGKWRYSMSIAQTFHTETAFRCRKGEFSADTASSRDNRLVEFMVDPYHVSINTSPTIASLACEACHVCRSSPSSTSTSRG